MLVSQSWQIWIHHRGYNSLVTVKYDMAKFKCFILFVMTSQWNKFTLSFLLFLLCLLSKGESWWCFETLIRERWELWKCVRKCLRKKPSVKQNWEICRYLLCVHKCVLKVYIQYIHSCLCWVDCFITLMKHSYAGCQMCFPVSNGEMSPCPRLRFFHQKRKWKHTLLARGREGLGRLLEEVREDGEREREKERTRGCSHLDLLYGHFHWTKSEVGGHFGFIG